MLVIRMQRTGRSGHAQFRVVVQDKRRTPTSGKLVASLGHYNPHSKVAVLEKEKAAFYLEHGAQPSERVARLLSAEGVKLPKWVSVSDQKKRTVRNVEKRRSTRPEAPKEETTKETVAVAETEVPLEAQAPVETPGEPTEVETPTDQPPAEGEEAKA